MKIKKYIITSLILLLSIELAITQDVITELPYSDDFESYDVGTPLINGINGWYSKTLHNNETNVIIQTNEYRSGFKAPIIPFNSILSNSFDITNSIIWVQFDTLPDLFDSDYSSQEVNSSASLQFFIASNGYFVVHDGPPTNWIVLTNDWLGEPVIPINTNEWVRINVKLDYNLYTWSLYANNQLLHDNLNFTSNTTSFSGFSVYNGGGSNSYIDNVIVKYTKSPGRSILLRRIGY